MHKNNKINLLRGKINRVSYIVRSDVGSATIKTIDFRKFLQTNAERLIIRFREVLRIDYLRAHFEFSSVEILNR